MFNKLCLRLSAFFLRLSGKSSKIEVWYDCSTAYGERVNFYVSDAFKLRCEPWEREELKHYFEQAKNLLMKY